MYIVKVSTGYTDRLESVCVWGGGGGGCGQLGGGGQLAGNWREA